MRDLVAKSTNPESVQAGSIPSPSSAPDGAEPAPNSVHPADSTTAPPDGIAAACDPGVRASAVPPSEVAEPASASCLLATQALQALHGSPDLVPGPTRIHLVDPPREKRGPRIDESGRRRAHIHTLYRPPGDSRFLQHLPLLRLTGNWLREAGFDIGQSIAVQVEPGHLVIDAI